MTTSNLLTNDSVLQSFINQNNDFTVERLRDIDFFKQDLVEQWQWENCDQEVISDRLKGYQRLMRVGMTIEEIQTLLKSTEAKQITLDSALAIASLSSAEFVDISGLDAERAQAIHKKAMQKTASAKHFLANVVQFGSPHSQSQLANNTASLHTQLQKDIPSYQKLFGSLNYLQCDPCRSIFSPAAYFVDLMRLIKDYIVIDQNSESALDQRRPDLAEIPLTCDNTTDTIPYTQIVVEVLEEALIQKLKLPKDVDIFYTLSTAKYPRILPANIYLDQIHLSLTHLGTNLADIYTTLHPETPHDEVWAAASLGLSPQEYTLITTESTKDVGDRYGISGDDICTTLQTESTFLKQTDLSWQELVSLLTQGLSKQEVEDGKAHQFFINETLADGQFLNLKDGTIEKLTNNTLDHLDRFVRLATKLNWSFADLDWVLTSACLGKKNLQKDTLINIAKIEQVRRQTKLPLDVLCGLWYDIKTIGKGNKARPQDLFDRVFNGPSIPSTAKWPSSDKHIFDIDSSKSDVEAKNLTIRKRLLGSLQLSDRDLSSLITNLQSGIWKGDTEIELSNDNLSVLYRHALMLKLLGLNAEEYIIFWQLDGQSQDLPQFLTIDTVIELLGRSQWLRKSGFSVYELDYIINGTEHLGVNPFLPKNKMSEFLEGLRKAVPPFENIDLLKLTPQQLKTIQKELKGQLPQTTLDELTKAKLEQLKKEGKLQDLEKTISQKLYQDEVIVKVANYFKVSLPLFEVIVPTAANLAQIPEAPNTSSLYGVIKYLLNPPEPPTPNMLSIIDREFVQKEIDYEKKEQEYKQKVPEFLAFISRILLFVNKLELSPDKIEGLQQHPNAISDDLKQLKSKNILALFELSTRLLQWFHHSADNLLTYLEEANSESFDQEKIAQKLARWTGLSQSFITQTVTTLAVQGKHETKYYYQSIEGLLQLKQCIDLCTAIYCHIDFPEDLCQVFGTDISNSKSSSSWTDYENLASSSVSLVKAKCGADQWEKVFEKLGGTLLERKSKMLSDYALWKFNLDNLRRLSEYLLLDVEMTSCACNSPIQLGILSLQTYLQRCRLGLEPDVQEVNIPEVWWEWMMNYRVWEANRMVFLYPENYLDPSLRQDASPIFKELQDELLQSNITAESVEAAYRKYFDKFAEVARLQMVDGGRFFVKTPKSPNAIETLFLFAKTLHKPHAFYYRTCEEPSTENPRWGYWQKIDLQIHSDYISSAYAFGRLFIFWVEMQKFEKQDKSQQNDNSKKSPKVVKASVKYSFQTASLKWVSPQTLIEDVEIAFNPSDPTIGQVGDIEFSRKLWEQVYPLVVPGEDLESAKISLVFGGLQSIDFKQFQAIESQVLQTRHHIINKGEELCSTVSENLLSSRTFQKYSIKANPIQLTLTNKCSHLASTTVGNFVLFAGGKTGENAYSQTIDVLAYENGQLIQKDSKLKLSETGRDSLAATTVGKFAIFAGGEDTDCSYPNVDVFTVEDGQLVEVPGHGLALSMKRYSLAATTVGNFAIFAGGSHVIGNQLYHNNVDVFTVKDGQLEELKNHGFTLSAPRSNLASITVKNLAIFAGGHTKSTDENGYSSKIDIFAYEKGELINKTNSEIALKTGRVHLGSASVGNLVIFAGGYTYSGYSHEIDIFAVEDGQLVEIKDHGLSLSIARGYLSSATVGNLVIFAGGQGVGNYYNKVDIFAYENGRLVEKQLGLELSQARCGLAAAVVGNLAIFAGGRISDNQTFTNRIDVLPVYDPTFKNPPSVGSDVPLNTTLTSIKNHPTGSIVQHQSQSFLYSGLGESITRLTTSTIQELSHTLFAEGLDGLLSLASQNTPEQDFLNIHNKKLDQLDFNGAYGTYFWEIFFHIPFLIGSTLNAHQRYDEARQWYQYIFNPNQCSPRSSHSLPKPIDSWPLNDNQLTIQDESGEYNSTLDESCYWGFLPFRGHTLQKLRGILSNSAEIAAYKEDPFDPHGIARLRIGAYEKAVVMKYIDNLLDWGDALFTQDTWESITQATTLYLQAYDLLGPKPKNLGQPPAQPAQTFNQLKQHTQGTSSEFLIDLETNRQEYQNFLKQFGDNVPFNALDAYFCIGENKEFAKYWDRVEDRLFKIRHCQNIKGIEQQLALFSPPIDPRQLVAQVAAGGGDISLPNVVDIPNYRFSYLLERAKGMVSTVMQLGSTLLSTLEKKDAEALAAMRATQEPMLLQLITKTKEKQIEEAEANLKSLNTSLESAKYRKKHYEKLMSGLLGELGKLMGKNLNLPGVPGLNARELASLELNVEALILQAEATDIRTEAIPGYLAPNIVGTSDGGMHFGDAINMGAVILDGIAGILNQGASITATIAQYQRRQEDWEFQKNMADWETQQIEVQIEAATVRIDLAKADLDVHNKSIEHSRQVEQFYKDKFTNKDLYQWMVGRLSSLYFQTYKIALDMANSAQKAYQYELTKNDTYIQSTSWDSNKKGLLAGESLMLGLNQLEKAYLDGNDRRLEIEKTISLRQLDPQDFLDLINKGSCTFSFDEKLFALDFPSHYCRQIKTISVSIPAVVGPYQNINATLTQTSNKVLVKPDTNALKWLLTKDGDTPDTGILRQDWRQNQQIAISKGTNDSGLFVLNFQDERYLPFEGTGVISNWQLDLPKASNPIDFASISDIIITVSYTALEGGSTIRDAVTDNFKMFTGQAVVNLKPELLQNPSSNELSFVVSPHSFRRNLDNDNISLLTDEDGGIHLQLRLSQSDETPKTLKLKIAENQEISFTCADLGNDIVSAKSDKGAKIKNIFAKPWTLSGIDTKNVTDIVMAIAYEGDIVWGASSQ